jgi:hypothetical protein
MQDWIDTRKNVTHIETIIMIESTINKLFGGPFLVLGSADDTSNDDWCDNVAAATDPQDWQFNAEKVERRLDTDPATLCYTIDKVPKAPLVFNSPKSQKDPKTFDLDEVADFFFLVKVLSGSSTVAARSVLFTLRRIDVFESDAQ